jgi:hypothetical protein
VASGFIVNSRLFPAHAICAVLTAMSAIFLAMYARSILRIRSTNARRVPARNRSSDQSSLKPMRLT